MKKNILALFIFLCLSGSNLLADETRELRFAPGLGYSTFSGLVVGGVFGVSQKWVDRWQLHLESELAVQASNGVTHFGLFAEGHFNFDDDFSKSGFVGGGFGFINHFPEADDGARGVIKLSAGYRLPLFSYENWRWVPSGNVLIAPGFLRISLIPIMFSYYF